MTTNDENREVEIKLYTPDLAGVADRLQAAGARLVHERIFERNMRYENAEQTLNEQGIVVRLREDSAIRLTYKGTGAVENDIISREEIEVTVSDYAAMDLILQRLGYFPAMRYEKYRTTYELDGAEILLDEMPFGNFTEIEADEATIERVIARLELDDADRIGASYARLFARVRHHLGLIFDDLTFANFDGIPVPASALRPIES